MVLEARCGRVSGWLGSYGWFHSYRLSICRLEDGEWGSRFPLVMMHSDCDGSYKSGEAKSLIAELDEIREGLAGQPYPVALFLGREKRELGYRAKYGKDGIVASIGDWLFGVDDEGILFVPYRHGKGKTNGGAPTRMKRVGKESSWFEIWSPKPEGTEEIVHSHKPAYEVFRGTHDLFRELAGESEKTGEEIVFC
jgi:hypothetical protein